ncbi:DUF4376 domain-containing protein [Bradyrhizobium ivorense]|uniref:DUF4376 domain-containing protein n=1 Tax=Bradyrhizobium ivorense TaxID=2511166 RepID=UPI0010B6A5C2|nr:DUF4376 domain-containing protein [Bradyrhizobium ivorense]VIO80123.1 hypothetical protein CI41S_70830 [Bradyrhizobium ivorense]
MFALKMRPEQVSTFSARLLAKEPRCQPLWDGEKFTIPDEFKKVAQEIYDLGFAHTGAELVAFATFERYVRETSGITFKGTQIATDRDSQARLVALHMVALNDPKFTTQWKTMDGKFIALDAATIIELATIVSKFVAACFSAEASINASIFSGALTHREQIKAKFDAIRV